MADNEQFEGNKDKVGMADSKNKTPSFVENDEIDLREIILLLWRNKWLIGGSALSFAAIAALVSLFYLTPAYESKAVIMEAKDQSASANFRGLGESSPLAALLSFGGPGQVLAKYNQILISRGLAAQIVDEYNLMERLEIEVDTEDPLGELQARERLIRSLQNGMNITAERDVLQMAFRHKDPEFAKDMIEAYLDGLRNFIRTNLSTQARSTEEFIAARLEEVEENLNTIEIEYLALKKEQGVVQLPSQINFSLNTASQLRSQIIEKDMQMELYSNIMKDSGEVQRLKQERTQLENQLRRLIGGNEAQTADREKLFELFTPLSASSELEFRFATAERHYLTQVKLAELLKQQLEVARIETKKSEPVFQVIDEPVAGVFPVSPNKRLNTILGFLLGMILSTFIVLIVNQFTGLPRTITRIIKVDVKEAPIQHRKAV